MNALAPYILNGTLLLSLGLGHSALAAQETQLPDCSFTGVFLGNDIDFNRAARELAPNSGSITVSCKTVAQTELKSGDLHLTFILSDLYRSGQQGDLMSASLVQVRRVVDDGTIPVGWAVLPHDVLDGRRIEPQIAQRDGLTLIRLASRHRQIYRFDNNSLYRIDAFEWRKDLNVDPSYRSDGQALSIDLENMEGRIAIVRTMGDTSPGQSAYEATRIAVASLTLKDGKDLAVTQHRIEDAPTDVDAFGLMAADQNVRSKLPNLPTGTEPCDLTGWSIDTDPKGLNIRSGPSISAPVLGTVPGPIALSEADKIRIGMNALRAEFRIVGYKSGWFLIKALSKPLTAGSTRLAASLKLSIDQRGWVSANMVSANPGASALPSGRLYRAPTTYAIFSRSPSVNERVSATAPPFKHVRACSGGWALVETADEQQGWIRGICSNQTGACH